MSVPTSSSISSVQPLRNAAADLGSLLTRYFNLGHVEQIVVYSGGKIPGSEGVLEELRSRGRLPGLFAMEAGSAPENLFRQVMNRILTSRRVTPYDRTTLLCIARSDFVPEDPERELIDKVFKHLNIGLIKVID